MVSRQLWERIEALAGPHTIDLMGLDSNARCSRHHTPFPTPCSTGTNFFAQNPSHSPQGEDENGHLFSPAYLIGPALQHIEATGATVTLLVYDVFPRLYGWPILCHSSCARLLLAKAEDPTALIWPSRTHGFSKRKKTCHFRGTCWPFDSLEQNPIERFHVFSFAFSSFRSVAQFGNLPSKWNATNVLPQMTFNTVSVRCAGLYGEMYTIVVRENRPSTPTP